MQTTLFELLGEENLKLLVDRFYQQFQVLFSQQLKQCGLHGAKFSHKLRKQPHRMLNLSQVLRGHIG